MEKKGWWQRARLPDGSIVEKKPRVAESIQKQKEERWNAKERALIFSGMRALQSKDLSKQSLQNRIRTTLQREGLVIDEMSFFRPHGPYSMMMPDVHEPMHTVVKEYRMLPIAADESQQEDAERIRSEIEQAKKGDLSPNQYKKLENDIERIREEIRKYKISKGEQEAEGIEELQPVVDGVEVPEVVEEPTKEVGSKRRQAQHVRWKEKWDKVQLKNKWKREWEKNRDATKEWSDFTERFMVLFTARLGWGGEGASAKSPAETDDVFHATDGIVHMDRVLMDEDEKTERVRQTYVFDTTDSAEEGIQKTANTLRFIDLSLLTTLEFAQTYDDDGNVEVEGMQSLVPRLNYVISRPLAAEIAILLQKNRYDLLALHPVQLMVLRQAQAQIHAYMGYIETEYSKDKRRQGNKVKIIKSFARMRDLIDAAAEEREAVLRDELNDLMEAQKTRSLDEREKEIYAMLIRGSLLWSGGGNNTYGEQYDSEHSKYVRAFRADRTEGTIIDTEGVQTRAWWRMTALTEKYPAVRTEEGPGGEKAKKPVPMLHKRGHFKGQDRTRARFRKNDKKEVVDTNAAVNNPSQEDAES